MKQIPNLFTLLNLLFGCLAIVFMLQNGITITVDSNGTQLIDLPEKIWLSSLFIGLAALVDFLDGFVARLFKVQSEMGKQLDSLADVVSFGVAPGIIFYQFLQLSFAQEEGGIDISVLWLVPAFILPCAAAYRLAKFNLQIKNEYIFKGVPTPAIGLLVASFPLIYWNVNEAWVLNLLLNKWFLFGLILILSYLMLSDIAFMSLKLRDYTLRNNLSKIILLVIGIIAFIFLQWLAVPVIFIVYILLSLLTSQKSFK
jgi:CDP-diacylglycerol---serine O-phosphatidyltransferase